MKRIISITMCLCLILSTLTFTGISALAYVYGYYAYTVTDGKATITDVDPSISGDITIPSELDGCSVTSIGDFAFSSCTALTNVTIPNSVTSIGDDAFYGCTSLTSVTIPNSVTSIGDYAFSGCSKLTSINVDENNSNYCDIDGVLFNKDKTTILAYPGGKTDTSYTIPDAITSIGESAFRGCKSLTSVTIPDSVTSIGGSAFRGCKSLTSVTIGNGVTSIGWYAFYYCESLTSITIPDSVTSIGGFAFYYCTSLKSVIVGKSVKTIGSYAFYNNSSLTDVYYKGSEEDWNAILIDSHNTAFDNATIHYNFKEDSDYYTYTVSKGEATITGVDTSISGDIEIPSELGGYPVTSIGSDAFRGCTSLTRVKIPNSVTSIGSSAFSGCASLTSIYILNKDCTIYDSSDTINSTATIYGYSGSTAESYATKYSRTFVAIGQVIIDGQVVDYDNSDGEFVLPEIVDNIGALYFDGYNYFKPGDKVPSDHNGNFTTVTRTPQMQPGAAVRLNNYSGIRFYTKVDTNYIETLRSMPETTVELGTLIAPKDLLNGEELSFDLSEEKYVDVKYSSDVFYKDDTGFEGVVGSLVNIRNSNISRDFVGRGYMKVTVVDEVKIFYSDYYDGNIDSNSRSIALLAYALKNDSFVFDNLNEEYKFLIEYWASEYMY